MNTCSRIESLGQKNKIHLSEEVVHLLEASGKGHWVIPRDGLVYPKGKQALQTYWLRLSSTSSGTGSSITDEPTRGPAVTDDAEDLLQQAPQLRENVSHHELEDPMLDGLLWQSAITKKTKSLIDWNTDVLCQLLATLVASREADRPRARAPEAAIVNPTARPLDEVVDVIPMATPSFEALESMNSMSARRPMISDDVRAEIRDYVHTIASTYPAHSFHNVSDQYGPSLVPLI